MNNKILSLLLVVMIVVVGGIGYLVYGEYKEYSMRKDQTNESKVLNEDSTLGEDFLEEGEILSVRAEEQILNFSNEKDKGNINTSNDEAVSKPTAREVYNKAQELFDKYTNYGNDYIPEIHDDLVIRETAEYFSISVTEANELYMVGAY